jgi:uncharacterized membrane protein YeaQ/YmgE (transglycosylase-associated protein family)
MFTLLVTSLLLYLAVGLIASVICCLFRPKKSPVVFAVSVIIGTMAAFTTTVLFAPAIGPSVAGIYVIPGAIAAFVAVILLECIAPTCCHSQINHDNVVKLSRPSEQKHAA